jgi:hypothetical protein
METLPSKQYTIHHHILIVNQKPQTLNVNSMAPMTTEMTAWKSWTATLMFSKRERPKLKRRGSGANIEADVYHDEKSRVEEMANPKPL